MKTKILTILSILLICFFTLSYCKSPVSPDIPEELLSPIIKYFRADPGQISYGESSMLFWNTVNASKVVIFCDDGIDPFAPGIAVVEKKGAMEVWPKRTTIYTLVASSAGGRITKFTKVKLVL